MVEVFFRKASQEELQSIVDLLVDRVVLTHEDKKHIVIRLKIPFDLFIADEDNFGLTFLIRRMKWKASIREQRRKRER